MCVHVHVHVGLAVLVPVPLPRVRTSTRRNHLEVSYLWVSCTNSRECCRCWSRARPAPPAGLARNGEHSGVVGNAVKPPASRKTELLPHAAVAGPFCTLHYSASSRGMSEQRRREVKQIAPLKKKRKKSRAFVTVEQSDDDRHNLSARSTAHQSLSVGQGPNGTATSAAAPAGTSKSQALRKFPCSVSPTTSTLPLAFESYYKRQGILPQEEWLQFVIALGRELPCSFRVSPGYTARMRALLESCPCGALGADEMPPSIESVPWLPRGYAYVVRTATGGGRQGLRRRAPRFHSWLTAEHESGRVTRQELVSMVPPLLLSPKHGECVLDMCASPGSKTSQLLHALVGEAEDYDSAAGLIVANDADAKRCSILTHQLRRYGPATSTALLITHHDAAHDPPPAPPGGYDRVLCDVPCSGDGTMRKNGSIATEWSSTNGLGRHALQLQILRQGLARLKVGGRLVYSTCSLNPHENEAVVCAALTTAAAHGGGGVVLEDCSAEMPALKRLPGLRTWEVLLPDGVAHSSPGAAAFIGEDCPRDEGRWYKSYADVPVALASSLSLPPTVFPPDPAVVASLGLERVWRLLPHHQDTGGFFVCAFRRTASAPIIGGGIPRPIGLPRLSRKQRKKQKRAAAVASVAGRKATKLVAGGSSSGWSLLGSSDVPAVQAAAEFFQLECLLGDAQAPTNQSRSAVNLSSMQRQPASAISKNYLFRRSKTVHLLTAAAASMAKTGHLNMVSCGSTILENGIGKKHSEQEGTQSGHGTGGGFVISQAALSLVLRWIASRKSREQEQEAETSGEQQEYACANSAEVKKGNRVVILNRQAVLALLEAKRSGIDGGKLKCTAAGLTEAAHSAEDIVLHETATVQVHQMEPGGCIVVCKLEPQQHSHNTLVASNHECCDQQVALSCWKSNPHWLQISGNDKAALAFMAAQLGKVESS